MEVRVCQSALRKNGTHTAGKMEDQVMVNFNGETAISLGKEAEKESRRSQSLPSFSLSSRAWVSVCGDYLGVCPFQRAERVSFVSWIEPVTPSLCSPAPQKVHCLKGRSWASTSAAHRRSSRLGPSLAVPFLLI